MSLMYAAADAAHALRLLADFEADPVAKSRVRDLLAAAREGQQLVVRIEGDVAAVVDRITGDPIGQPEAPATKRGKPAAAPAEGDA